MAARKSIPTNSRDNRDTYWQFQGPILGLISLILVAGGIVLQFLVILSGAISGSPESQIYFLQTSTNGISPQPRNPSRWTFFSVCGVDANGHNTDCGAIVPALPFDPPHRDNFGTSTGVPAAFLGYVYPKLPLFT
jgi:hypothetical protein